MLVDDLIIYSKTIEEHITKLEKVFCRLESENLLIQATKCKLLYNEINVLGFAINAEGMQMDKHMLSGVRDLPIPKTKKQVSKILGFFSYFRKFIHNFAKLPFPLTQLHPEKATMKRGHERQSAFDGIKEALLTAPVLALFDPEKETILKTDACNFGVGVCIFQIIDGVEKPVAFASKSLTKRQQNRTTTE